jgi:hypothetical protein
LAVVTALLAHTACFGSSHAFGGPGGFDLIAASLAGTALLAILAPFALGFAPPTSTARLDPPVGAALRLFLTLAGGGACVYMGMERLEGHSPALVSGAWAALGISALVVALVALLAAHGLRRLGQAIAATLAILTPASAPGSTLLSHATQPFTSRLLPHASRGRAPPLFA